MTAIHHSSFTVERVLPGSPDHAYRFWSEPALKQSWNSCHPDWTMLDEQFDFRLGGQDLSRMRAPDGRINSVDIRYLDLLAGQRIVYAYSMHVDGEPLSASLVTIELLPRGSDTKMVYIEHLAMLVGDPEMRRLGTEGGFDRLVAAVERELATLQ